MGPGCGLRRTGQGPIERISGLRCRTALGFPTTMYTTHHSLLERVKDRRDSVAWQEFYDFYRPLVLRYGRQRGLRPADAEEIVGQCFESLSQAMQSFEYQPSRGKFKSWLRKLVERKISDHLARRREDLLSNSMIDALVPDGDPRDEIWEQSWKNETLSACLRQVRSEINDRSFRVFHLSVIEGWPPSKIASMLDMTPEQVYRAKYKVLQNIREKLSKYMSEE